MPRWLTKVVGRVRALALQRRLRMTGKAAREGAALGLDLEDVRDVLVRLRSVDSAGRRVSNLTGEWMYVFKPRIEAGLVYVKLILRSESVVVSFHEDDGGGHEEDESSSTPRRTRAFPRSR